MSSDIAIRVRNVDKIYRIFARPLDKLKQQVLRHRRYYGEHQALHNINIEIPRGNTIGLIGRNGSGKSTLLQVIAGIIPPNRGTVDVYGKTQALLELGAGFNPEFSGRENVQIAGVMSGLSAGEVSDRIGEIEEFADIGQFMDYPIKTYSSGMFIRLAFAGAICFDPDILLVDEALSVGDAVFQMKCMNRINTLRQQGVTILFVSHDLETVKNICDACILIDSGEIFAAGKTSDTVNLYWKLITEGRDSISEIFQKNDLTMEDFESLEPNAASDQLNPRLEKYRSRKPISGEDDNIAEDAFRFGQGSIRVTQTVLCDLAGNVIQQVQPHQEVVLRLTFEVKENQKDIDVGFAIKDKFGNDIIVCTTFEEQVHVPETSAGDFYTFEFTFPMPIKPDIYSISSILAENRHRTIKYLDWVENAMTIEVIPDSRKIIYSRVDVPVKIQWEKRIDKEQAGKHE